MSNVMYDKNILMGLDEFDAAIVEKNFSDPIDYFRRIDEFVRDSPQYLRAYNPTVVIFGDDVRKQFMAELSAFKDMVEALGIKVSATDLSTLEDAVNTNSEKGLSDGIVKFGAKLDIIVNQIKKAQSGASNNSGEQVLVDDADKPVIIAVDDSLIILNILREMLGELYKIIALTSGKEALMAAERFTPSLFLLDIEMPEMNGHELAEKIQAMERNKNTPILFLTSSASSKHVMAAKKMGIKDYILKPVDQDVLIGKLKMYINA